MNLFIIFQQLCINSLIVTTYYKMPDRISIANNYEIHPKPYTRQALNKLR